jgi:hypothetical protein
LVEGTARASQAVSEAAGDWQRDERIPCGEKGLPDAREIARLVRGPHDTCQFAQHFRVAGGGAFLRKQMKQFGRTFCER